MSAIAPAPPSPPPPSPPKPTTPSAPPAAVPHGTPAKPEPAKEPDDLRASLEAAFAPAKPAEKPAEKPPEKPDGNGKPAEASKPDAQAAKPESDKVVNMAAMRKQIDDLKAERDTYKAKAEKPEPIEEHPQFKTQTQRLSEIQKQWEEAEKELKIANYSRSAEYREKYKKPLEKAWTEAYREIESLTYTDTEGNERQATKEQFHELMQLPKKQSAEKAEELFGRHMGQELMNHRRSVENLHRESVEAVSNFQNEANEREQKTLEERTRQNESARKMWETSNQEVAEKFSAIFLPTEGDEKGNSLLAQGYSLVDRVLGAFVKGDPFSKTQKGIADLALVRHSAAAIGRMVHRIKETEAKLAKAESDLAEFRKGDAAQGDAGGRVDGNGKPDSAEADAVLESAFKRR